MSRFNKKVNVSYGGRKVKNQFELDILTEANNKAPQGSVIEYETEKKPYVSEHTYNPDIPITLPSGRKFYIEVKGNGRAWSPDVRRKMLLVKKQHPDMDIRFVFYSDGKFGSRRKDGTFQTQSEWAKKNGFMYSIGSIPEEWFDEEDKTERQ